MILIQLVLAIGLLFVSLLLFIMMRQIAVIAERVPKNTDNPGVSPLAVGTAIPVREVETYDRKNRIVFSSGIEGGAVLLFASFTCPVCNPLLRQLTNSPRDLQNRIVLYMLDTDIERRFAKQIYNMGLQRFPIVEAYDLASQFRIYRAPFVYVVDGEGIVLDASPIISTNDLVALVRKQYGRATGKESAHVSRSYAHQSPGHPRESIGELAVAKVHTP